MGLVDQAITYDLANGADSQRDTHANRRSDIINNTKTYIIIIQRVSSITTNLIATLGPFIVLRLFTKTLIKRGNRENFTR